PAGPAPPRRSVCAPAAMSIHSIADQLRMGERTMSLHSWLQNLRSVLAPGRGQRHHRRRGALRAARHRPNLEILEDRTVPSTFTVLNLADSGEGSLHQAVLAANANPGADAIDFADGLHGTIALGGVQLSITDHLAIEGPGAELLAVSGSGQSRVF